MRNRFDEQLLKLNKAIIEMGAMCEEAITNTSKALIEGDLKLASEVIEDSNDIDHLEHDIETQCMKLLLHQQPVAKDLRLISAVLKMITDMERIGDQAEDIAEIIIYLNDDRGIDLALIKEMADATIKMVTLSIDSFIKKDESLAHDVIRQDDIVDDYFIRIKSALIKLIKDNAIDGEYALDLLMISKYYERIGDHATNIAEWVIYSITGIHKEE